MVSYVQQLKTDVNLLKAVLLNSRIESKHKYWPVVIKWHRATKTRLTRISVYCPRIRPDKVTYVVTDLPDDRKHDSAPFSPEYSALVCYLADSLTEDRFRFLELSDLSENVRPSKGGSMFGISGEYFNRLDRCGSRLAYGGND
jgi:hypothetical protein